MYDNTVRANMPCDVYMLSRPYLRQWQQGIGGEDDIELCRRGPGVLPAASPKAARVSVRTWGDMFAVIWRDILRVFDFRF